jgi:hypothetical protein
VSTPAEVRENWRWRQGEYDDESRFHDESRYHVYVQTGPRASKSDRCVGVFADPEDAELAVACVNTIEAMRRAGVTAAHLSSAVLRARLGPAADAEPLSPEQYATQHPPGA